MKKVIAAVAAVATVIISACSTTQKVPGSQTSTNAKDSTAAVEAIAEARQDSIRAAEKAAKKLAKEEAKKAKEAKKELAKVLNNRRNDIGLEAHWFLKNRGDSLIATEHGDSYIEFTKGFPKASEDLKKAFSKEGFKVTGALINTSRNSNYNFSFRTEVKVQDSTGTQSFFVNGCKVKLRQ